MSEDILDLQNKISELEEELEDKEIMINLLLKEVKRSRSISLENLYKRNLYSSENIPKRVKIDESEEVFTVNKNENGTPAYTVCDNNILITNNEVTAHTNEPFVKNDMQPSKNEVSWVYKYKLKEDVEYFLGKKKVVKVFKDNVFFDEFVEFCSDVYLLKTFEPVNISHVKNVKKYLLENKTRVLKYLIMNINKIPFSSVCSTFLALSTEFSGTEKLVIIHDIILYIQDFSKLLFYSFCILNCETFADEEILKHSIYSILSFQYTVDLEIHKSKKIITNSLFSINNILRLKNSIPLEDILIAINTDIPVFLKNKFNPDIYKYVYSIRSISHFLDWDYVYNTYISYHLSKDITPCKILYMGLLGFNSLRLFGTSESTDIIFRFIKDNMISSEDIGVISYLLIKQINEKDSSNYLERESIELKNKGYDIEYLKKLLIF